MPDTGQLNQQAPVRPVFSAKVITPKILEASLNVNSVMHESKVEDKVAQNEDKYVK